MDDLFIKATEVENNLKILNTLIQEKEIFYNGCLNHLWNNDSDN